MPRTSKLCVEKNIVESEMQTFTPLLCSCWKLCHPCSFNLGHWRAWSKNLSGTIQGDLTLKKAPSKCVTSLERLCSNLSFYLNEVIPQGTLG